MFRVFKDIKTYVRIVLFITYLIPFIIYLGENNKLNLLLGNSNLYKAKKRIYYTNDLWRIEFERRDMQNCGWERVDSTQNIIPTTNLDSVE